MRRAFAVKVTRLTLGDLPACLVLPTPRDVGMSRQKTAEAVVAAWHRSGEVTRRPGIGAGPEARRYDAPASIGCQAT